MIKKIINYSQKKYIITIFLNKKNPKILNLQKWLSMFIIYITSCFFISCRNFNEQIPKSNSLNDFDNFINTNNNKYKEIESGFSLANNKYNNYANNNKLNIGAYNNLDIMLKNNFSKPKKIVKHKNKINTKFSTDFPEYRVMHPGFNVEGMCMNPQCNAYKKYAWSPHGYKNERYGGKVNVFNLYEEIIKSTCPLCREKLKHVKGYSFYKAICEYEANEKFKNNLKKQINVFNDNENFVYHKIDKDWLKNFSFINIIINPTKSDIEKV